MEEVMPSFVWRHPTRIIFGRGKLSTLPDVVDEIVGPGARVFLATGRHSLRAQGALQPVLDSLVPRHVTLFDRVTSFPSPALVAEALAECRRVEATVVVAIGGGSPMDLAKAVAILMSNDGTALHPRCTGRRWHSPAFR